MVRDIRKAMPMTAQTDDSKFPDYRYEPYPRMMVNRALEKLARLMVPPST